jgi:mRNA-degrading endonuclease RelE of RelBE toxin-antitoxin system
MSGSSQPRTKIGDFQDRSIDDDNLIITILAVRHRSKAYD